MRMGDGQQLELFVCHDLLEIFEKSKLSQCLFDDDLPKGNNADDDIVVGVANLVTDPSRKPW